MRILVLGGSIFLGRHIVQHALEQGHTVTLFNRGQHNPDLFPGVERLRGDRRASGGLTALGGRTWDVAIDTSGYIPREVSASTMCLADAVQRYVFISTKSVYRDFRKRDEDESYPTGTLVDPTVEEITGETYGPLKASCERVVEAQFPHRCLIVRPGLIVGPHDPTDRFTYWPGRVARGGELLAPAGPDYQVQFIDVRDLASWIVRAAEQHVTGVMNADGAPGSITLGRVLDTAQALVGSGTVITWVSEDFLLGAGVTPWSELPLWVPTSDEEMRGFSAVSVARAVHAGLTSRPLAETVRDTLAWAATRPAAHRWAAGLSPEREAELLRQWHAHQGQ